MTRGIEASAFWGEKVEILYFFREIKKNTRLRKK